MKCESLVKLIAMLSNVKSTLGIYYLFFLILSTPTRRKIIPKTLSKVGTYGQV